MKTFIQLALMAALTAAPGAIAQSASPTPGHYCLRTDIGVVEDDGPPAASLNKLDEALPDRRAKLGKLGVDVDIIQAGGQLSVGFSTYMPDNGQVVRTEPVKAQIGAGGVLTFAFTDNWRTPGAGRVAAEGDAIVLTITRTREADTFAGEYAARQFGEFKLKPGTCPANR